MKLQRACLHDGSFGRHLAVPALHPQLQRRAAALVQVRVQVANCALRAQVHQHALQATGEQSEVHWTWEQWQGSRQLLQGSDGGQGNVKSRVAAAPALQGAA